MDPAFLFRDVISIESVQQKNIWGHLAHRIGIGVIIRDPFPWLAEPSLCVLATSWIRGDHFLTPKHGTS